MKGFCVLDRPIEPLSIGALAQRAGLSTPTLRYYEERGLIRSVRTAGNARRFPRHMLRRLAVIAAGQTVGLSLEQIQTALDEIPLDRAPTQREWSARSSHWALIVQERISTLEKLSTDLDTCIGCGCLSLGRCVLFNPGDEAADEGTGSRWVRNSFTSPPSEIS